MFISDVSAAELFDLEPHGPDTYVGLAPVYPWGRLFGGQVVAQALRAAQLTVDPAARCHSLHSYFIRGGTSSEPVRFEVDRIRNGRSFTTRRVVARQSNGAILNMSASFQTEEEAADVTTMSPPSDLPGPDGLPDFGWGNMLDRRLARTEPGRVQTWMRLTSDLGPDPHGQLAACALAFISDSVPTGAARSAHPVQVPRSDTHKVFMGASLDHSVYFQRPVDPGEWLLADVVSHGLVGARGLTVGTIFDAAGVHVASVTQEVLLRERRKASEGEGALGGKTV